MGTPAARDLSNAKLALNQSVSLACHAVSVPKSIGSRQVSFRHLQVLLSHIERLTQVTERQGEMLDRIMSLLDAQAGRQVEVAEPGTKES